LHVSLRRRALLGAAAAVPAALSLTVPTAASAAPAPATQPEDDPSPDRFCSTSLLTPAEMDAGVTSTVVCYDTLDDSLRSVGVDPAAVPASLSSGQVVALSGEGFVAVHHRNNNGLGESLSIRGSECNGGGLNFGPGDYWNDAFRSTTNRACSTVKHWSEPNYSGDMATTTGIGSSNLGSVSGRVSSIKYFGPAN